MESREPESGEAELPVHLSERTRRADLAVSAPLAWQFQPGEFILYWLRSAMRVDENPALDVAVLLARSLGLPLLVYQGLSQRHTFASDRHHLFVMQGARELDASFRELGIPYCFHLERPSAMQPALALLAQRARAVVTEDTPAGPAREFLQALLQRVRTPVYCVDTACVVPMRLIPSAPERAFQFRELTDAWYEERIRRGWPQPDWLDSEWQRNSWQWFERFRVQLPFPPIDWQTADLVSLIGECQIDHSVGPVPHTCGGSLPGYARWNAFLDRGLRTYARRRNDPLSGGSSRMSAYLHHGMVSPFRLAREAAAAPGEGATKYLEELLVWRELAWAFCFHRPDHEEWSALPEWARQTLLSHRHDPRPVLLSSDQLARGRSGDPLWDAAQVSLLQQGELHNNLRMTWGKALLQWNRDPAAALQRIVELNHRYALDGSDPASWGGILWCLGLFDRPFHPEQAVFGTVRTRPTAEHARRLDVAALARHAHRPLWPSRPRIAVIGAGISGSFAARTLVDHGAEIVVFEKSRGAGGRMATRRTDVATFDHGAQYFTVRDRRFQRLVASWIEQGLVAEWQGDFVTIEAGVVQAERKPTPRYVAVPGMSALARYLLEEVQVTGETRIENVEREGERFLLLDAAGVRHGPFDRVISTAPGPQTARLFALDPQLAAAAGMARMNPCFAAMVVLPQRLPVGWSGAFPRNSFLSWLARNGTKPHRDAAREALVLHASGDWTTTHLDEDPQAVAGWMLQEFWRVTGLPPEDPVHLAAHRWMYAIPDPALPQPFLSDRAATLVAAGDWTGGPRVEGAFLAGMSAAGAILRSLALASTGREQPPLQGTLF